MAGASSEETLPGSEDVVWLERTASGFTAELAAAPDATMTLSSSEISRSGVLCTTYESSSEGSRVPLRCSPIQLREWYSHVRGSLPRNEPSTSSLLGILKVWTLVCIDTTYKQLPLCLSTLDCQAACCREHRRYQI